VGRGHELPRQLAPVVVAAHAHPIRRRSRTRAPEDRHAVHRSTEGAGHLRGAGEGVFSLCCVKLDGVAGRDVERVGSIVGPAFPRWGERLVPPNWNRVFRHDRQRLFVNLDRRVLHKLERALVGGTGRGEDGVLRGVPGLHDGIRGEFVRRIGNRGLDGGVAAGGEEQGKSNRNRVSAHRGTQ
jgi:hypothetical protein